VINFENHYNVECWIDPFETAETRARTHWYGVSGIPDVRIDGKYSVVGAANCGDAASDYEGMVERRLDETGGLSPIEILGEYEIGDGRMTMSARFHLVDPITPGELRGTFVVYEDNVYATGMWFFDDRWQHVTRRILDETLTLAVPGDLDSMRVEVPCPPEWNTSELHVVAYVQRTGGDKAILQGALLTRGTLGVAAGPSLTNSWLDEPRPNPFASSTMLAFEIPFAAESVPIRLEVFDACGRKIAGLIDASMPAGRHSAVWNGRSDQGAAVRSGIYFARLTAGSHGWSRKLILVRS
jgi:hypothetical protein